VARATVESVAENLVDGFMAPLFFAAIGGAPLAVTYKMINTLDSMVGYKNDRYYKFGKVSARMDDLFNYLPARLSIFIISLCSGILGKSALKGTLTTAIKDGRKHSSPNAGFPEAAFAGTLNVRLGGPNMYHGQRVEKPYIGKEFGPVKIEDIEKACRLMLLSALAWAVFMWLMLIIIQ
jgi:adenosylcobinamide-phosphate synthase